MKENVGAHGCTKQTDPGLAGEGKNGANSQSRGGLEGRRISTDNMSQYLVQGPYGGYDKNLIPARPGKGSPPGGTEGMTKRHRCADDRQLRKKQEEPLCSMGRLSKSLRHGPAYTTLDFVRELDYFQLEHNFTHLLERKV